MPCYHPMTVWRSRTGRNKDTGKWPIVFKPRDGYEDLKIQIPCGKCIGCRLERSRQWAIRCLNESQLYTQNCFLTLTYKDKCIPCLPDGRPTLHERDFTLFMKRLRRAYAGKTIRFFHCGEYGEQLGRPHHHCCLFNHDFSDKYVFTRRQNIPLYRSEELETLWPHGNSLIGSVTFESAAYIARYVTKKITGEIADAHYNGIKPEYITMSRNPGIGKPWLDKYGKNVYCVDAQYIRPGIIAKPAKYYDKKYDELGLVDLDKIKSQRRGELKRTVKPSSDERLLAREQWKKLQLKGKIQRSFENGTGNICD